jgi:phthalate 4,5-dioxygenase oxygenase subunit
VPLLGEKLVAFRDTTGRVGLVQENCPHRGASLYFGRNEDASIRCLYHGWAFNADGVCIDMPSEPVPFCEKVRMRAYPTHESGGIVWAYLGPREAMTPFRDFGTEGHDASEFFAMKTLTRCNWVQAMEGNIDSAHISWLHQWDSIADIPDDGSDKPGYPVTAYALPYSSMVASSPTLRSRRRSPRTPTASRHATTPPTTTTRSTVTSSGTASSAASATSAART